MALALETPFPVKEVSDSRDASAVNQNFRSLSDSLKKERNRINELPTLAGDNNWTGSSTFGDVSIDTATINFASTFNGPMIGPQIVSVWVNFTGTGTVTIQDSYGVGPSSVSRLGTGNYRIFFSTPFVNDDYSFSMGVKDTGGARFGYLDAQDAASVDMRTSNTGGSSVDTQSVSFMAVGRQ